MIGIKENLYFQAAQAIGSPPWRTVLRHVLPNVLAPIIVIFSITIGAVIITEASLSFLGFGLPLSVPSWGGLLSREGRNYMQVAPLPASARPLTISGSAASGPISRGNRWGPPQYPVLSPAVNLVMRRQLRQRPAGAVGRASRCSSAARSGKLGAMKFRELAEIVADEPLFETGLLLAGAVDPADLHRQLSRWTRSGQIRQLRRGLYTLAPPWEKRVPHPFLVANRLVPGSYVSGLSALAFAHAIPEYVAEVTNVTPGKPQMRQTPLGRFTFRHLKPGLMFGYRHADLGGGQRAFVAEPEKALLDLIHLQPGGDDEAYLRELRLNLDAVRLDLLDSFAETGATPKLARAAGRIRRIAGEALGYDTL